MSNGSTYNTTDGENRENQQYTKSYIYHLVSNSKWSKLRVVLETNEGQNALKECSPMQRPTDVSILHELLSNDPPIDLFLMILSIVGSDQLKNPDLDDFGRNPFHKALTNRADFALVKKIITDYPECASTTDDTGVTPLMIECSMGGNACDYRIVKLLVRAAPESVMLEDIDGCSALEYALMSGAIDVFKRLQHFHAHELRKKSEAAAEKRRVQFLKKNTNTTIARELTESFAKLDSVTGERKSTRVSRGSRAA